MEFDEQINTDYKILRISAPSLSLQNDEDGQVTVHCSLSATRASYMARIWKSTLLKDNDSNHTSKLIAVYGISVYPNWTEIEFGTTLNFTLLFSSLPKSCLTFDLIEQVVGTGSFYSPKIMRNNNDVYYLDFSDL